MDDSLKGKNITSVRRLEDCAKNITSQSGEDGILERMFELIPGKDRWCCEFGAWDGKEYSNTFQLISSKNWAGVLIEANPGKYKQLKKTYERNDQVVLINRFVEHEGEGLLDKLLGNTSIPIDFDLLSIDIDGNDYHIWASFDNYKPKVVVIEYNQSIPNHIEFIQKADPKICHGSSLLSITKLAKTKGYELVAVTDTNAIYVRSDYFPLFNIAPNDLSTMRPFAPYQTDIFQLFDGTVVLTGYKRMIWHAVAIPDSKVQVVPYYLRKFPGAMENMRLLVMKVWRLFFRFLNPN